ncbi:hypothetical protein BLNAU_23779 [Blattamonas nauphoetae]|uniref:Ubiquitin-like protease family profile domain-containing protein n=1 Tax=Blattamonas nauphoetae TaxID=2049346 RepID=A0ABQ9WP74_9EUKA|nr:hypothetical protein BLNAU_23779 [Blattamonas nauphoetae]
MKGLSFVDPSPHTTQHRSISLLRTGYTLNIFLTHFASSLRKHCGDFLHEIQSNSANNQYDNQKADDPYILLDQNQDDDIAPLQSLPEDRVDGTPLEGKEVRNPELTSLQNIMLNSHRDKWMSDTPPNHLFSWDSIWEHDITETDAPPIPYPLSFHDSARWRTYLSYVSICSNLILADFVFYQKEVDLLIQHSTQIDPSIFVQLSTPPHDQESPPEMTRSKPISSSYLLPVYSFQIGNTAISPIDSVAVLKLPTHTFSKPNSDTTLTSHFNLRLPTISLDVSSTDFPNTELLSHFHISSQQDLSRPHSPITLTIDFATLTSPTQPGYAYLNQKENVAVVAIHLSEQSHPYTDPTPHFFKHATSFEDSPRQDLLERDNWMIIVFGLPSDGLRCPHYPDWLNNIVPQFFDPLLPDLLRFETPQTEDDIPGTQPDGAEETSSPNFASSSSSMASFEPFSTDLSITPQVSLPSPYNPSSSSEPPPPHLINLSHTIPFFIHSLLFSFATPLNPLLPASYSFRALSPHWAQYLIFLSSYPTYSPSRPNQTLNISRFPHPAQLARTPALVRFHYSLHVAYDYQYHLMSSSPEPLPFKSLLQGLAFSNPSFTLQNISTLPLPHSIPSISLLPSSPALSFILAKTIFTYRFLHMDSTMELTSFPPNAQAGGQISITVGEMDRLQQRRFLNDTIISFFAKYLQEMIRGDSKDNNPDNQTPFRGQIQEYSVQEADKKEDQVFAILSTYFFKYLDEGCTYIDRLRPHYRTRSTDRKTAEDHNSSEHRPQKKTVIRKKPKRKVKTAVVDLDPQKDKNDIDDKNEGNEEDKDEAIEEKEGNEDLDKAVKSVEDDKEEDNDEMNDEGASKAEIHSKSPTDILQKEPAEMEEPQRELKSIERRKRNLRSDNHEKTTSKPDPNMETRNHFIPDTTRTKSEKDNHAGNTKNTKPKLSSSRTTQIKRKLGSLRNRVVPKAFVPNPTKSVPHQKEESDEKKSSSDINFDHEFIDDDEQSFQQTTFPKIVPNNDTQPVSISPPILSDPTDDAVGEIELQTDHLDSDDFIQHSHPHPPLGNQVGGGPRRDDLDGESLQPFIPTTLDQAAQEDLSDYQDLVEACLEKEPAEKEVTVKQENNNLLSSPQEIATLTSDQSLTNAALLTTKPPSLVVRSPIVQPPTSSSMDVSAACVHSSSFYNRIEPRFIPLEPTQPDIVVDGNDGYHPKPRPTGHEIINNYIRCPLPLCDPGFLPLTFPFEGISHDLLCPVAKDVDPTILLTTQEGSDLSAVPGDDLPPFYFLRSVGIDFGKDLPLDVNLDFNAAGPMGGYNHVKRWSRRLNLFTHKFFLIPINEKTHWSLAIICYPQIILENTPFEGPLPGRQMPTTLPECEQMRIEKSAWRRMETMFEMKRNQQMRQQNDFKNVQIQVDTKSYFEDILMTSSQPEIKSYWSKCLKFSTLHGQNSNVFIDFSIPPRTTPYTSWNSQLIEGETVGDILSAADCLSPADFIENPLLYKQVEDRMKRLLEHLNGPISDSQSIRRALRRILEKRKSKIEEEVKEIETQQSADTIGIQPDNALQPDIIDVSGTTDPTVANPSQNIVTELSHDVDVRLSGGGPTLRVRKSTEETKPVAKPTQPGDEQIQADHQPNLIGSSHSSRPKRGSPRKQEEEARLYMEKANQRIKEQHEDVKRIKQEHLQTHPQPPPKTRSREKGEKMMKTKETMKHQSTNDEQFVYTPHHPAPTLNLTKLNEVGTKRKESHAEPKTKTQPHNKTTKPTSLPTQNDSAGPLTTRFSRQKSLSPPLDPLSLSVPPSRSLSPLPPSPKSHRSLSFQSFKAAPTSIVPDFSPSTSIHQPQGSLSTNILTASSTTHSPPNSLSHSVDAFTHSPTVPPFATISTTDAIEPTTTIPSTMPVITSPDPKNDFLDLFSPSITFSDMLTGKQSRNVIGSFCDHSDEVTFAPTARKGAVRITSVTHDLIHPENLFGRFNKKIDYMPDQSRIKQINPDGSLQHRILEDDDDSEDVEEETTSPKKIKRQRSDKKESSKTKKPKPSRKNVAPPLASVNQPGTQPELLMPPVPHEFPLLTLTHQLQPSTITQRTKQIARIRKNTLIRSILPSLDSNQGLTSHGKVFAALGQKQNYFAKSPRLMILFLDSLPEPPPNVYYPRHSALLRSYLSFESFYRKNRILNTNYALFSRSNIPSYAPVVPHQKNSFDCGVYLLKNIEMFMTSVLFFTSLPQTPSLPTYTMNRMAEREATIYENIRMHQGHYQEPHFMPYRKKLKWEARLELAERLKTTQSMEETLTKKELSSNTDKHSEWLKKLNQTIPTHKQMKKKDQINLISDDDVVFAPVRVVSFDPFPFSLTSDNNAEWYDVESVFRWRNAFCDLVELLTVINPDFMNTVWNDMPPESRIFEWMRHRVEEIGIECRVQDNGQFAGNVIHHNF